MPGGDRTGPMGMGPMTGRGWGYCTGNVGPGYANAGYGYGMGRGRGFRRMCYATGFPGWARYGTYPQNFTPYPYAYPGAMPEGDEKEILQNQANFLQNQLNEVQERLKNLEKNE